MSNINDSGNINEIIQLLKIELISFYNENNSKNSSHFYRNILPNNDSILQKILLNQWEVNRINEISYLEILDAGFRCFSQNEEDGIILKIFSKIGIKNRFSIEIGANCSQSDLEIPENLTTNLIINHNWHGKIIEKDESQCGKIKHFFAKNIKTKHFHDIKKSINCYYSPEVICREVSEQNINELIKSESALIPDLLTIDIDSSDFNIIRSIDNLNARVLIVEFEKKFRDIYSVYYVKDDPDKNVWKLSGTTSLKAWVKYLKTKKYILCAISDSGFNAFFVKEEEAFYKIKELSISDAFNLHPILGKVDKDFWEKPNENWMEY